MNSSELPNLPQTNPIQTEFSGVNVEKKFTESGIEETKITFEPNSDFLVGVRFRTFGEHESDWHSTASDNLDDQNIPFLLDAESIQVHNFSEELFSNVHAPSSDFNFVSEFDNTFTRMLPSAEISMQESFRSLSDIVNVGRATCAAKVTLAGKILSDKYPKLLIQEISGQNEIVENKITKPYGHVWLRIESDTYVALYDPMYSSIFLQKKFSVDSRAREMGDKEHFFGCSVSTHAVGQLHRTVPMRKFSSNIVIAKTFDGKGMSGFLTKEESLHAQISGGYEFAFYTEKGGSAELFESCLKADAGGASQYYPLVKIQMLKE